MAKKNNKNENKITKVEITPEKITGRGGLMFFLQYIDNIGFLMLIEKHFGYLIRSRKGLGIKQIIKQIVSFIIDGTDMSISSFDAKKEDVGYMAILENDYKEMASSHQIKRFFQKFRFVNKYFFRLILKWLFIWRLRLEKPEIIILQADTMVMDNDSAKKREGCNPTYKKKKGFQNLHITWDKYLIDVIFRSGEKHSNHGDDFYNSVARNVEIIRRYYKKDVPIILTTDSGFMSDKNFTRFEKELKVHYICTGKFYDYITEYIRLNDKNSFASYKNGKNLWKWIEIGSKLKSWKTFRRTIYTTLTTEKDGQLVMDFGKPDNIIYTNLGTDKELDDQLSKADGGKYLNGEGIIGLCHARGADELIHRSLKELATKEQLPFKKFEMNRAYYYFLVFSHFLFECYKRDVCYDIISPVSYPNTFRRKLIDFAAKIVSSGNYVILKVSEAIFNNMKVLEMWKRCKEPPLIQMV